MCVWGGGGAVRVRHVTRGSKLGHLLSCQINILNLIQTSLYDYFRYIMCVYIYIYTFALDKVWHNSIWLIVSCCNN